MLLPFSAISDLEKLLTDNRTVIVQDQQSYGPFLFGQFVGKNDQFLIIAQPAENIYAKITYVRCSVNNLDRFIEYEIRFPYEYGYDPIGKIKLTGRMYEPNLMYCKVSQGILFSTGATLLYNWESNGKLDSIEVFGCGEGCGQEKDIEEMKRIESFQAFDFPWQIDVEKKVEEVLNLSGYKDFFKILIDQTPCELCHKTLAEHDSDCRYQPLQMRSFAECKVCGKKKLVHNNCDHEHESIYAVDPYIDLLKFFPTRY